MSPSYAIPSEKTLDILVHIVGLSFASAACFYMVSLTNERTPLRTDLGLGLYGVGLLSTYICSTLYNSAREGPKKRFLRHFDHAAIFIMIAGTYSPFCLIALDEPLRALLFSFIWSAALAGACLKIFSPGRFERLAITIYLLMGWSGVMVIHSLLIAIPHQSLLLLGIGGLVYSLGVIFHVNERLPYNDALWHSFVFAAAICHFMAVIKIVGLEA